MPTNPNTIRTRIQLKYDLYSNWQASAFVPLKGEVCIAEIPNNTSSSGLTPPAIGIKVGDGEHVFSQLPWIQGIAGDVYSWAKAANKPGYAASEITMNSFDETPISSNVEAVITAIKNRVDALTAGEGSGSIADQIASAIENLDGNITGTPGAGKTFTAFVESDGVITATFEDIQITESQVTNLTTDLNSKAPLASPNLTGTPTAPTAAAGTNTTQIATTAFVKDAVDTATAGLSGAMHYKGTVTANPTVTAPTGTFTAGDVVTYNISEYVYDGTNWRELGTEGSYALNTITITGSDGLTGGGAISSNQTITHAIPSGAAANTKGNSGGRTYIQTITTDKFGHITGTTTATETVTDTTYTFSEGSTNGAFNVTPDGGNTQSVPIHGLGDAAYADIASAVDNSTNANKLATAGQVASTVNGLTGSAIATAADGNQYSVLTGVTETNGVISKTSEVKLAAIAKTGDIYDIIASETNTTTTGGIKYLVFDCGSATVLVD